MKPIFSMIIGVLVASIGAAFLISGTESTLSTAIFCFDIFMGGLLAGIGWLQRIIFSAH